MRDLSRSLVDAAAEAMRLERVRCLRDTGTSASPEQESAAGVAAVLEALAVHCDPVPVEDGATSQALLSNTELRRWAGEVKESGGG